VLTMTNDLDKICGEIATQFHVQKIFSAETPPPTAGQKSCRLRDNVKILKKIKKNSPEPHRPADGNIIRRARFVCCITKAIDTHSEYIILLASPQEQGLYERASSFTNICPVNTKAFGTSCVNHQPSNSYL